MTSLETGDNPAPSLPERGEAIVDILKSIRPVNDLSAETKLIHELTTPQGPKVLSFINAHAVNLAWTAPLLQHAFLSSDIILRAGIGVEIVLPWFDVPPGLNMCGTDLIPKIIEAYNGRPVAVFGTQSPWLDAAAEKIEDAGGTVCVTADGFQDTDHYLKLAEVHRPDLIVLAMGMPKQELLSQNLKSALNHDVLIVNGGAVIDFIGGKVSRAPEFIRKVKMEWGYRLVLEPKRLFERYVVGNPLFLLRCMRLSRRQS